MAHINRKTRTATLSLAESMVLASAKPQDGREIDSVGRAVRAQVQPIADALGRSVEVYACRRHGGHIVDVVDPRD